MERVCVKVDNLRKLYSEDINFQKWLEEPDNVYVGRRGRIFINKTIFTYKGSKWENKFTVKEYGLDKCLELYEEYIKKKIEDEPDTYNIDELKNKKLGCWCLNKDKCHVDILLKIIKEEEK